MRLLLLIFLLRVMASTAVPLWGAEGVISKTVAVPGTNYCHLKFPAIREETLYWNRPALKDPSEGDMIDFYGPCDHDPLGREEIRRQKAQLRERERPKGD